MSGQAQVPFGRGTMTLGGIEPGKCYYARPAHLRADTERRLWMSRHAGVSERGDKGSLLVGLDRNGKLHVWPLPDQDFDITRDPVGDHYIPVDEAHFEATLVDRTLLSRRILMAR